MTSAVPGNGNGGSGGASTKKVPRLPIQNAPSPTPASGARTAPAAPLPRATSSDDNNGDGGGRPSLSGAHSAPPLTRSGHHQQQQPVPTCPLCKQRATTQWRYWSEHKEWIWHCSARNSVGAFCGVMWRSGRPRADCLICGLPLSIEEHNGVYGYWCLTCQDFSQ